MWLGRIYNSPTLDRLSDRQGCGSRKLKLFPIVEQILGLDLSWWGSRIHRRYLCSFFRETRRRLQNYQAVSLERFFPRLCYVHSSYPQCYFNLRDTRCPDFDAIEDIYEPKTALAKPDPSCKTIPHSGDVCRTTANYPRQGLVAGVRRSREEELERAGTTLARGVQDGVLARWLKHRGRVEVHRAAVHVDYVVRAPRLGARARRCWIRPRESTDHSAIPAGPGTRTGARPRGGIPGFGGAQWRIPCAGRSGRIRWRPRARCGLMASPWRKCA